MFSYDFNQKTFESLDDEFEDALEFGWDKVEFSRGETEEEDEGRRYNQTHDDVIRDKVLRIFDFYSRKREKESKGLSEDFIEKVNYK